MLDENVIYKAVRETDLPFKTFGGYLSMERDRVYLKPTKYTGNGAYICFSCGKFDHWLVPMVRSVGKKKEIAYAHDEWYFARLASLALCFGADVVWQDIQSMFAHWTDEITRENLVEIDDISKRYGRYENEMYQLLLHIYFGAIAEEHYQRVYADGSIKRTKVGKLMKLYALHRLLLEGVDPLVCATETVNIAPQRLLALCEARGLKREVTWQPYSSKYDKPETLPVTKYGAKKRV